MDSTDHDPLNLRINLDLAGSAEVDINLLLLETSQRTGSDNRGTTNGFESYIKFMISNEPCRTAQSNADHL